VLDIALEDYSLPATTGPEECVLVRVKTLKDKRLLRTEARRIYEFIESVGCEVLIEPLVNDFKYNRFLVVGNPENVLDQKEIVAIMFLIVPTYLGVESQAK
jgi:hypothetical protein